MDEPTWQPLRGPFLRWPRLTDLALVGLSFFFTLAPLLYDEGLESHFLSAVVIFTIGSAALYWRRSKPVRTQGIVLAASALSMWLAITSGPIVALAFSTYGLGRYSNNGFWSYTALSIAVALVAISQFSSLTPLSEAVIPVLLLPLIWYIGKRVQMRGEYLQLLQERARYLEQEQQAEAKRAVTQERTRIAREMHDIVAHQVSLMTVQAGAAKIVIDSDPAAAAKAMASVETEGRKALQELRHLVGVLRPEGEGAELMPQPGLADVPALLQAVRNSGLEVEASIEGIKHGLPARLDLSIYRIVQEALTNVIKHAGPKARAEVSIRRSRQGISVEVRDNGQGTGRLPGAGHGITGMQERAHQLGGQLQAEVLPGGGFSVTALLPWTELPA